MAGIMIMARRNENKSIISLCAEHQRNPRRAEQGGNNGVSASSYHHAYGNARKRSGISRSGENNGEGNKKKIISIAIYILTPSIMAYV